MSLSERLAQCKAEVEKLRDSIESTKQALANGSLGSVGLSRRQLGPAPRRRRVLQGHYGKVYALDWAGDSEHLVSASQDGKLLVWNGRTKHKVQVIPLKSTWVMTCAFETSSNRIVAAGGLDNECSIYAVGPNSGGAGLTSQRAQLELQGHDGYLSCCRFVGPRSIVTASGDSTCILWDLERGEDVQHFTDHAGDVMAVAVHPTNKDVFVSGSCDATAKVWDIRTGRCVQTFVGHESDINAVRFMGCGLAFASGSDDASVKVFDLRSYARVNEMVNESVVCGITSVDFSASGRVVFAGYDDCNAHGWDVLAENAQAPVYTLAGHSNRVSCLGVTGTGQALATGSWDQELAIWA